MLCFSEPPGRLEVPPSVFDSSSSPKLKLQIPKPGERPRFEAVRITRCRQPLGLERAMHFSPARCDAGGSAPHPLRSGLLAVLWPSPGSVLARHACTNDTAM